MAVRSASDWVTTPRPYLDVLDVLALRESSHMCLLYGGRRFELRATGRYHPSCLRALGGLGGFGDNGPGYAAAAMACVRRRFKTLSTAHFRT